MSTKLKKIKICEKCGEDNEFYYLSYEENYIHIINMFEHYITNRTDFNKLNLLKTLKDLRKEVLNGTN